MTSRKTTTASRRVAESLSRLKQALTARDLPGAERLLPGVMLLAAGDPELPLLVARTHRLAGRRGEARRVLEEGVAKSPNDLRLQFELVSLLTELDELPPAMSMLDRIAQGTLDGARLVDLAIAYDLAGVPDKALALAEQARLQGVADRRLGLQLGRLYLMLGRIDAAAAEYRSLIRAGQRVAEAWFSLLDMKTVRLDDAELAALKRLSKQHGHAPDEQTLIDFALARALEADGQYEAAFRALELANRGLRQRLRWNAASHARFIDDVARAFSRDEPPLPASAARGGEVIFLVGMPRSGSTVVEQVLASHPSVEGASELAVLPSLLAGESERRRQPFPDWVPSATADDWARLGEAYLARTARWRATRPLSTDKFPDNWKYVGAIRRMLPGAHIIDCRRDLVETCWSCYKQLFAPDLANYSYSLDDVADYCRDYLRLMAHWDTVGIPVRCQSHERLLDDREVEVRALLHFVGLPFHADCLRPHESRRPVRTASSAQVRQPLRAPSSQVEPYGALLDPLRQRLQAR
ncbi:MAG TPA: sulfotransferase [Dokdonella sp.]|uniref:tetratricopeptide repeat-containing sulfotransferase family protein n=1 Tax=Dokdonella sp. TaxID=2291710 RepID=UPI0025BC3EA3|nr:tetratricopeptide repeat-containing sulfotransferase family protein [Dokdonella sp.]MBX3691045.1 sulfotransferase [Dokdonella sp.]HNR91859.1 sulfotransferase [Dokdonella sp.]